MNRLNRSTTGTRVHAKNVPRNDKISTPYGNEMKNRFTGMPVPLASSSVSSGSPITTIVLRGLGALRAGR